jgi:hypothetical protein
MRFLWTTNQYRKKTSGRKIAKSIELKNTPVTPLMTNFHVYIGDGFTKQPCPVPLIINEIKHPIINNKI